MSLLKEISELVNANVISQETAEKIQNYYKEKGNKTYSKTLLIFGVLGALLIGLGIILIVAHNWDLFSKTTKLIVSFIPLFTGQILCGYSFFKKHENIVWKESGSTFLFFAIGANISLIGQIYNLHSDLSLFIITWMLIFFPIIYLMRSSTGSLLYLIGITFYACENGYWSFPTSESIYYWILLLILMPHYYSLIKRDPQSNFLNLHNWFIPLSIIISLGIVANKFEEFMFLAYFSLFSLFQIIGNLNFAKNTKSKVNGYTFFGSLGIIVILLILSFEWFWNDLQNKSFQFNAVIFSPELISTIIISAISFYFFIKIFKSKSQKEFDWGSLMFVVFILIFFIGFYTHISVVLINLLTLSIGIITIKRGTDQNHLGILNYGLLIVTSLIACRFFDTDLSFVTRGIIFIVVGIGFFLSNFWMLKKRRSNVK
ncbi:MAG: DUF2157 domain-containing protein [Ignavibacteriae bacterium]|nr:DUF2157 domain-containing protein [Ignavibacteriota bacterium]